MSKQTDILEGLKLNKINEFKNIGNTNSNLAKAFKSTDSTKKSSEPQILDTDKNIRATIIGVLNNQKCKLVIEETTDNTMELIFDIGLVFTRLGITWVLGEERDLPLKAYNITTDKMGREKEKDSIINDQKKYLYLFLHRVRTWIDTITRV